LCSCRLPAGQCTGVVPVHSAGWTVEFLRQETPDFISLDLWPPISLHLNTVEYKTWGCKQEHTRSQYTLHGPAEAAPGGIRADFEQTIVNKVIDQWSKQLGAFVKTQGQHFEHPLFIIISEDRKKLLGQTYVVDQTTLFCNNAMVVIVTMQVVLDLYQTF